MKSYFLLALFLLTTACARANLPTIAMPTATRNLTSGNYEQSLAHAGRARTYIVHLPSATRDTPLPLVIVLHGGGGTGAGMQTLTRGGWNALADREGFVVVYPDGIEKQWNDGRQLAQARAMRENVDDVGFLAALIDDLARTLNVDRRRVYATGISNGGMMSQRLACELSDQIAAIGVVAATMSENLCATCKPSRSISVLLMPGVNDPLVPYQGGEIGLGKIKRGNGLSVADTVKFWAVHNQCADSPRGVPVPDKEPQDGTRVRQEIYAPCHAGSEVILFAIEGGGHTWPSGQQYLPEAIVGKTSRDIDANQVLWDFFKRHARE